jgi:hypothetical protein
VTAYTAYSTSTATTTTTTTTTTTRPTIDVSTTLGTTYFPQSRIVQIVPTSDYILREIEFPSTTIRSKKSDKDKLKKSDILPSDHPLRFVLPESARVVGIQSESGLFHPHIMTLAEFLEASRNMDKIHAIRLLIFFHSLIIL